MEVAAKLKFVRLSAQKCRLMCDLVRGMPIERARDVLRFSPKRSAGLVKKVLDSAIANAEHNFGLDIDDLRIARIYADQGPSYNRMQARAKGRGSSIRKPTCHVTVVLSDSEK